MSLNFEPGQKLWNVFCLNRQNQHGCWVCACWSYGMKARLACYGMNDWICLFYSMCFICSILRWFVMWPFPMSYTRLCQCYNSLLKWLKWCIVLSYWSPIVHVSEFGTLVLCMQDARVAGCSWKLSVQNNFQGRVHECGAMCSDTVGICDQLVFVCSKIR